MTKGTVTVTPDAAGSFKRVHPMKTDILTDGGRFGDVDDMSFGLGMGDGLGTAYRSVLGSALDNIMEQRTYEQLELLEEKREEIQHIIKKRQRKVALAAAIKSSESTGKPTMASYVGRTKGLPSISGPRSEVSIHDPTEGSDRAKSKLSDLPLDKLDSLVDGAELMGPNAMDRLQDERDVSPHERKPRAPSDSEDEQDVRIQQLPEAARVNRATSKNPDFSPALKDLEGSESRPPGRPTLMTEKRAELDGWKSKDPETDRAMARIKQKAQRTKGASALKMVSALASPARPLSGVPLETCPPATPRMLDAAGRETDAAIDKIFHG